MNHQHVSCRERINRASSKPDSRSCTNDAPFPYVVVSPSPLLLLCPKDRIFVIGELMDHWTSSDVEIHSSVSIKTEAKSP